MPAAIVGVGLFVAAGYTLGAPQVVERREVGQLMLENIPETPPALAESLRSYENARAAYFQDWLDDGSMLIITRFGQTAQIHRVAFPGGAREQLTFYDEPIADALARPGKADRFLFRRDTGGAEYFQIYSSTLAGTAKTITEPGTRNLAPAFSRDGAFVAWSSVQKGKADHDILIMRVDDPASQRRAFHGEGEVVPEAFSPDGRTLVFTRVISAASQKLYLLDIATSATRELNSSTDEINYGRAQFTPDSEALILTSNEGAEFNRLVRLDLASGKPSQLGESANWDVELTDLSPDGQTVAYAVNEEGRSKIYLRPLVGGTVKPVSGLPTGVIRALKFSPDSKRLATCLDSATTPADVWSFEPGTGKLERWTRSENGGLDPADFVEPSLIRVSSFDKRSIPAFLYEPRAVGRAAVRLPVIISIHGGPEAQERPGFQPVYQYWVKELGVAVITPNIRGSKGYGRGYLALDNGLKRQDAVEDIGALLDWIATRPELDPTRVVVAGGSYGGFMALSVFSRYGDRLAGAYDVVGMSNLVTFLEHTEEYRRDLRRAEYGDERDPSMRKFMEDTAPLNNTTKMTKPLFVVAGKNDPRVPYTEAEQLIAKVRAGGGNVWYMLAKDEGHGFRKKPNRDAQRAAETQWLREVLSLGTVRASE